MKVERREEMREVSDRKRKGEGSPKNKSPNTVKRQKKRGQSNLSVRMR